MASCLGLYIEKRLIKYAKVKKDHENLKVEAYGIMFYDNLSNAIDQIIEETNSKAIPISINVSNEKYNIYHIFSLLNKNDIEKAIQTEYEMDYTEKGINTKGYQARFVLVKDLEKEDKFRVLHVVSDVIGLNKRKEALAKYRLANMAPMPMIISNLIESKQKRNYLIVNIEEKTTITTVINHQVYNIQTLETGADEILNKISEKENSYSKAYEICKNTTIYSSEAKELMNIEVNDLETIMITLNKIVSEVKDIMANNTETIHKIYITGSIALVNNVDLYFQEYIPEVKCELLKPFFIKSTRGVNIKDYMEVNSAISLALMGLGRGIEGINFHKQSISKNILNTMKIEVGAKGKTKITGFSKNWFEGFFENDLRQALTKTEKNLIRATSFILLFLLIYGGFSLMLYKGMEAKEKETQELTTHIKQEIAKIDSDNTKVLAKTNGYETLIQNLQDVNDRIADATKSRNAIPNLLNSIMYVIPENVQITSIVNTSNRHIEIYAQSNKYEQLGYLKARLKSDVILTNVISTAGQKDGGVVTVKIEGDLP